ncbi:MAG TPA: hypothetical protein VFN44_17385 [Solirubrobacteraceae bacterium]|nr:hypothetical protein [Solirubrobacteraceae bacterium]
MRRRLAPVLLLAALAGCGGGEERASSTSTPAGAGPAKFVSEVDATCGRVRDAAREGPRFPFRDFDPSNPDGRLRAVGRFYRRLDSERTVRALATDLRKLDPPASLEAPYTQMLGSLDVLVEAMGAQTSAAVAGSRARMVEATAAVDRAFDSLGDTASDTGAFLCALSLERNPKTIR